MHTFTPLRLLVLTGCISLAACAPTADPGPGGGTGGKGGSTGGSGGRGGSGGSTGGSGGSGGATGGTTGGSGGATGGTGGSTGGSGGATGGTGGSTGGTGGSSGSTGGTGGSTGGTGGSTGGTGDSGTDGGTASEMPSTGFPPGPKKVVLITGDDRNMADPSRTQMIRILESMKDSHGIMLEEIDANLVRAANMMDKQLLIASPNANYFGVTPEAALKTLPVPIIVSKDGNTTAFGIGTFQNTPEYTAGLPVKLTIINPTHELAAGLTGTVGVLTTRCRLVRASNLGPGAIKIATTPEQPASSWGLFAYEKGAMLPGNVPAPAKRVGFFWHRPSGPTPEGEKLFRAAVVWALKP